MAPAAPLLPMPGYSIKRDTIAIRGVATLRIQSLLDRDQYADPLGEAQALGISSAQWPLFGLAWPSGLQLAAQVGDRAVVAGERILEVGCGLALASLVAHRRGADVTASDCHPLTGRFLRRNLRLNGLPPLKYRQGLWADRATAWTPPSTLSPPAPESVVRGRFDLIMGSDVLYERDDGGALAGFVGHHAQPRAEVWIVDPDRGNRPAFSRRMADQGFALDEQRLDRPAHDGAAAYKGRLLRYLR
ncbi:MAG: class I SAM-dependent methyltransferase [Aquabacterium sp.]